MEYDSSICNKYKPESSYIQQVEENKRVPPAMVQRVGEIEEQTGF